MGGWCLKEDRNRLNKYVTKSEHTPEMESKKWEEQDKSYDVIVIGRSTRICPFDDTWQYEAVCIVNIKGDCKRASPRPSSAASRCTASGIRDSGELTRPSGLFSGQPDKHVLCTGAADGLEPLDCYNTPYRRHEGGVGLFKQRPG